MTVYASSLLDDEDEEERAVGFQRILDVMVDPAVEMCMSVSEEKERIMPQWDGAVFVLNCLSYLQVCEYSSILNVDSCSLFGGEEHFRTVLVYA
jgi:hypothetical protein